MCNERRATFQKVMMEDNGTVHHAYSLTMSRVQVWVSVFVGLTVLIASLFGSVAWIHASVKHVAETTFDEQLDVFHDKAQPAMRSLIDERIEVHRLASAGDLAAQLAGIEKRLTTLETTVAVELPNVRKAVDKNSDKLDLLILKVASK